MGVSESTGAARMVAIEVPIPKGWVPVGFRCATTGDACLGRSTIDGSWEVQRWFRKSASFMPLVILEKCK
jgi:hypothetical protein